MIHNIHILTQPHDDYLELQVIAAQAKPLIDAHRRGEHPWGSMRRDCPLCQLGR